MSTSTIILTPLLSVVLIIALLYVARMVEGWRSLRVGDRVAAEERDRIALEDRKERTLLTLKDLELEYEMGKLGSEDYEDLKHFYEHEAIRIIERLDALK